MNTGLGALAFTRRRDVRHGDADIGADGHKQHVRHGDAHAGAERHSQDTHHDDAHVGVDGHSQDAPTRQLAATLGDHSTPRATQTIPPALRRAVLRRDHERCRVPGCTHATFLDLHHIVPRSDGGQHAPENIITLCGAHHRAAHRGTLLVTGSARQPHFQHADGSEYGHAEKPRAIEAQTRVFSALRHLGFRERDIQAVLGELRKHNDLREVSTEGLLREALRRLAPPRVKPIR